jgi:signal transduction histidine kinase
MLLACPSNNLALPKTWPRSWACARRRSSPNGGRSAGQLLAELNLDKPTITDHLPDVIAEITRDLALSRDGTLSAEHTRGSPPSHGVQRFHDGLDVGEVVAEYNLLRVAFNSVAERNGVYVAGDSARIINHRIDEAVRMAVMAFAAQQALIRKEQDDEHLAFIAHDLRTPLNAVSLLVEELRYGMDEKALAQSGDLFDSLKRNLTRAGDLIKKVLETRAQPSGWEARFGLNVARLTSGRWFSV